MKLGLQLIDHGASGHAPKTTAATLGRQWSVQPPLTAADGWKPTRTEDCPEQLGLSHRPSSFRLVRRLPVALTVNVNTKRVTNDFVVTLRVTSAGGGVSGGVAKCGSIKV
jgi:hypothetical protein